MNNLQHNNRTIHVLLAEDNLLLQYVIKQMLRKRGFKVSVVKNGKQAVENLKEHPVDIVLMAAVATCMAGGLELFFTPAQVDIFLSFFLLLIFSWFTYRFVDVISGIAAFICLLVFVFNVYTSLGEFTIFSFPFVLMALTALAYFFSKGKTKQNSYFI